MTKSQKEKQGPALRAANVVLDAEGSKCLSSIYIPTDLKLSVHWLQRVSV